MLISTKGRYASRMLVDIAMHQGDHEYVSMKDVAVRQQISKKYMEAFTAPLAAAGILGIRRGKTGGYRLLVPPDEITLWQIVCLIEGPLHAVACLERPVNECARCGFCITLPAWEGLEKVVHDYLESVSLQQLIDQAKPQPSNLEDYPCGV
ncbi:MAG: Rrf2 family transcriptional regulator [Clostridia bacterium]|nr:Rrf2 family transcriptional regulator [Clostridia bacterium]